MVKLYTKNPKTVFVFSALILLVVIYGNFAGFLARAKVESFLADVATHTISAQPPIPPEIMIRGKADENPAQTLVALQQMEVGANHHSHPTDRIDIEVKIGGRSLHLILKRDSNDGQEYWVYCPDFKFVWNDIGRLQTTAFDRY